MNTEINLEQYVNEYTEAQKNEIDNFILKNYESLPKGLKISFKARNMNIREVLMRTYYGYKAEKRVLEHLQQLNPNQDWHFIDSKAGYYHLEYRPNNQPDLINNKGITVEVKNYIVYIDKVYFICLYQDIDKLWAGMFHNADYVVITYQDKMYLIDKQYFIDNVISYPNNFDPVKTTWELNLEGYNG